MKHQLWVVVLLAGITCTECAPKGRWSPDLDSPPVIVTLRPDAEWTDTGMTVSEGARFFFTASGEIFWTRRKTAAGPDGVNGGLGWYIGGGGLIGRIGATSKPFDIGARTHPFQSRYVRSRRQFSPPPIEMARS